MRIRPEFLRALSRTIDLARLEESKSTIFGLGPELRLAYYNPAWLEYAAKNGAPSLSQSWPLGRSLLAVLPPPIRAFYVEGYASALGSGCSFRAQYFAHTPHRLRTMSMEAQPLAGRAGLIVTHSLVSEAPLIGGRPPDDKRFRREGRLDQCTWCRAFRSCEESWDQVPQWLVLPPPQVRASLCPACAIILQPPRALAA